MSITDTSDIERKLVERIDPITARTVELSPDVGGLGFTNMAQAMEFARVMAISGVAIPKHLRGNVGACVAITIQAVEWHLSPFAVANKSYSVNDRLAYESQLVQAVVLQRAPIKGRFGVEFFGEGDKRCCTVTATLKGGGEVDYTSPEIGRIPVKNSPLWKGDPDQQLFYYSGRALCRRHFPDVLLGIYTQDELYDASEPGPESARDVTPKTTLADKLDALAAYGKQQPSDPQHDADTGEIISGEMAERAQAKTAAAAASETPQPSGKKVPALGPVPLSPVPSGESGLAAEHMQQDAGGSILPDAPASDPAFQTLLGQSRAAAARGTAMFKHWTNCLNAPDYARIEPHLPSLHEEAAEADAVLA